MYIVFVVVEGHVSPFAEFTVKFPEHQHTLNLVNFAGENFNVGETFLMRVIFTIILLSP